MHVQPNPYLHAHPPVTGTQRDTPRRSPTLNNKTGVQGSVREPSALNDGV